MAIRWNTKRLILAGAVAALSASCTITDSSKKGSVVERQQAAERICKLLPVEIYFEPTFQNAFSQFPEPERSKLIKNAMNNLDKKRMHDKLVSAYASNYSPQTLEAMADFMETPAGVEYTTKFREFTQSFMPTFTEEAVRVVYGETVSKD